MKLTTKMTTVLLVGGLLPLLIPTLAGHVGAQTCGQPPAGMVSWWPGDEHANDVQNGNHGTLVDGTTFVLGKVGQAFSLDGVNDYVQASDNGLPAGANPGTIVAWVKTTDGGERYFVIYGTNDFNQLRSLAMLNGKLMTTNFGLHIQGATTINDGQFHHVAVTFDGSTYRLYVDGTLDASGSMTTNTVLSGQLRIGHNFLEPPHPFTFFTSGLIDEVEVYNRALSAPEIQAIFAAGNAGHCKVPPPDECQLFVIQLQQELAAAEEEIQALQGQVTTLSGQNTQLQQELQTVQAQLVQLTTVVTNGLTSLTIDFQSVFSDPMFVIPGATLEEQYQNLIAAILNLNKGRKEGIYVNLGGKPGK